MADTAEAKRNSAPMYPHIQRTMKICGILGVIGFTPLLLFGQDIVTLLLGEGWELSGRILEYFTLAFFLGFMWSPISSVYLLIDQQKEGFIMGIMNAGIRLLGLAFIPLCVTNSEMISLFAIVYTLGFISDGIWYFRWIKQIKAYDSAGSSKGSSA